MESKEHKILLVEPPFVRLLKNTYSLDRLPLSLGYLSGMILKKTNWKVMVYNADFFPQSEYQKVNWETTTGFNYYLKNLNDPLKPIWREVELVMSKFNPDVVGISSKSQNFASACMVARIAKKINNEIIVIVGGPHSSMVGPEVLDCAEIDVSVMGEAENTIVELLNAISSKGKIDAIKGIVFRNNRGQVVQNPPADLIANLDCLCFPSENAPVVLKDYEQYPRVSFKNIFATRGCPFNCFYCGSRNVWGRKVRFRSPSNVIKEIEILQKRGLQSFHFNDDEFGGANKQYINDLCSALAEHRPKIRWSCLLHVKMVDEETISIMKKAGCFAAALGVESGNDEILKKMRKNITISEAFSAADIIKKHHIVLTTYFMVGLPWETEETLNDTVEAIKRINCDQVVYSIFTPYPATEAFEFCKKNNLIKADFDLSLYNHQSPANCFCLYLSPQKFRAIVSQIETWVDKKNSRNRLRQSFSFNTYWRIRELGVQSSIRKAGKIVRALS